MMPGLIRTAVIGVGHLGWFHAQKYAQLEGCDLIGVVDKNLARAQFVGKELAVPFYQNCNALLDQVDAVSVVVPTKDHYQLAKIFIEHGIHVLVEKPFTATLAQAKELIALSQLYHVHLQVGHLERFNVVFSKFQKLIDCPQYIECVRISKFPKRGTDIDVILDLMIHDIDLVLTLLNQTPVSIDSVGTAVLTTKVDLANARLKFANGCVTNFVASRVSDKSERKMRIFQKGLYLSLDYGTGNVRKLELDPEERLQDEDLKPMVFQMEKNDALLEEIRSFLHSIQHQTPPLVPAEAGLKAMEVAWKIKAQMKHSS